MIFFKMIHENKCADGKSLSNETRMESLNEIQTLFDKIGYKTSLEQHVIRSTKVRWLTYKEDMEHWEEDMEHSHKHRHIIFIFI